jgi:hypothetical protein
MAPPFAYRVIFPVVPYWGSVMKRAILAFAAGLVLWVLIISVLNVALRRLFSGYAAAEPTMSFTLGMLLARLVIGALTSLIAGGVAGWIAPASARVPVLLGAILLLAFIPIHVRLWSLFPFWYHLVFLGTLLPLVVLGSRLTRAGSVRGAAAGGARP